MPYSCIPVVLFRTDVGRHAHGSRMDDMSRLDAALEAMLIVAAEPVSAGRLAAVVAEVDEVDPDVEMVEGRLQAISARIARERRGFELANIDGKWLIRAAEECSVAVSDFLIADPGAVRLTEPVMETLAVIAYRQPVTKRQIEMVRGHDPMATIRTLVEQGYVCEVGRDRTPAQAVLYGTTERFLASFGLRSLADLPSLDEPVDG